MALALTIKGVRMAKAKGIHAYGFFKLGKAPVKKDARNLKLAMFLKALPYPDAERLVLVSGTHPDVSQHPVLGL